MILDITEIKYLFIVLELSVVEYLFSFFSFFPFSTFCFHWNGLNSQTYWLDISQQTIKWLACPCQEDAWYSRSFMCERNARACIKCSSWIVKEDGQEQHLTYKPNSCCFSFGLNGWHFGHKCLPFSLTLTSFMSV